MNAYAEVAEAIQAQTGLQCAREPGQTVGGGSIAQSHRWACGPGWLFVKLAPLEEQSLLEGEADGLERLRAAQAVRVPRVRAQGATPRFAFLALEWIERGTGAACERLLGERLAAQHRVTRAGFGLERDNHIGRTPQANGWKASWPEFFAERRLRPQLRWAVHKGMEELEGPGERLLEGLPALLPHAPDASLLHGDLWGGNWLCDRSGEPVIFDPAVYYGDREADLAMTRLFGGFGREFYAAYEASWPLPPGSRTRVDLYNLYHVLNHANLFGGGYARQARDLIDRLLTQLG